MGYTKTNWQDGVDMKVNAERLNNIEDGIKGLSDTVLEIQEATEEVQETVKNMPALPDDASEGQVPTKTTDGIAWKTPVTIVPYESEDDVSVDSFAERLTALENAKRDDAIRITALENTAGDINSILDVINGVII